MTKRPLVTVLLALALLTLAVGISYADETIEVLVDGLLEHANEAVMKLAATAVWVMQTVDQAPVEQREELLRTYVTYVYQLAVQWYTFLENLEPTLRYELAAVVRRLD